MKEIADRLELILSEEEEDNTSKNTLEELDSTDALEGRIKEVIRETLEELRTPSLETRTKNTSFSAS